jgi:hypothetical protein
LVKMCMASSIWGSTKCSLTWKPLVIKQRCCGFRLVPSMHHTLGNGSGFWLTPQAQDSKHSGLGMSDQGRDLLSVQVHQMWPTPNVPNGGRTIHHATVTGRTAMHNGKKVQIGLEAAVGGQLNPTWVEWLMGYPTGWTGLEGSGTPSSRKSRKRSGG